MNVRYETRKAKNGRYGRVAIRNGQPFAYLFYSKNIPAGKHYVIYVPSENLYVYFEEIESANFYFPAIAEGIYRDKPTCDHVESTYSDPVFREFQADVRAAFSRATNFEKLEGRLGLQ